MPVLRETVGEAGWVGGVVCATDPSLLDLLASPRGRNSALAKASAGKPYVQKRLGMEVQNRTAITSSPKIIGLKEFRHLADSTSHFLVVDNIGGLHTGANAGTTISTSAFTSGEHFPDFAVANDLCFIVNGTDQKKFNGTTLTAFGTTRPTVGTMAGAAGAAGLPNGTYELRVTYGVSATGYESSASNTAAATVTVTNQQISWTNIPVSGDAQIDRRFLYARNIATQTQFYRVGTITNNSATTATTNTLDANNTTPAPSTTSNDAPPSTSKFIAYNQQAGRMFVATTTTLYYSQLTKPEAFESDPNVGGYEAFSDGQPITGLCYDRDVLIIFKEDRTYLLRGTDPRTWELSLLDGAKGCGSHRTIVVAGDGHTYWWSRMGLCRWDGLTASVDDVGMRLYGSPADRISYDDIIEASATLDEDNHRLLIALPGAGQSRATFILPFCTTSGVFESDAWDPMDLSCLGQFTASGESLVYGGNYAGQMFQLWTANNDGIAEGTSTGTFTAAATSVSVITDSGATFDTTGAALKERKVTLVDSSGNIVTLMPRPYVASNTGTALTLSTTISGLMVGSVYTYIVGGPVFEWDTPWRTFGQPWIKKRFEYLFLLTKGASFGASARVGVSFDYDDTNMAVRVFETRVTGAAWDAPTSIWDESVWDASTNAQERFRLGRVGFSWRARITNAEVDQPFAMLYLGAQGVLQTTKR